jgi:hypothetical protein
MANPEHLEILSQGVEVWNKWREDNPTIKPDLQEAVLNSFDLSRFVLTESNLTKAELREARLRGAALQGAVLFNADLLRANFNFAQLNEADLRSCALNFGDFAFANLKETDLSWSDLTNVNFTWSTLQRTNFANAQFGGCTFGSNDLSSVTGLDTVRHFGTTAIGIDTIYKSGDKIPESFLRLCGVPENFITFARSLVNKPIKFYSCFISYSNRNEDITFAERLYADLQSNGVDCWFAPQDLKIGDRFRVTIDESIRIHDKLLLILSKDSVESPWVEKEVETAMESEREQGRGSVVLFPITLDDAIFNEKTGWAGDIQRARHIGNFREWKNPDEYRKAFDRLLRDLRAESARREGDAAGAEIVTS